MMSTFIYHLYIWLITSDTAIKTYNCLWKSLRQIKQVRRRRRKKHIKCPMFGFMTFNFWILCWLSCSMLSWSKRFRDFGFPYMIWKSVFQSHLYGIQPTAISVHHQHNNLSFLESLTLLCSLGVLLLFPSISARGTPGWSHGPLTFIAFQE